MMCRFLPSMLTAVAVVALPQLIAAAESEKRPQRPGPQLFQRLDANRDGQVALDEIPEGAPDQLKEMLKKADRNGDKRISPDELAEAMKRSYAALGRRPSGAADAKPGAPRPQGPAGFMHMFRDGRPGPPDAKPDSSRRPGPPSFVPGSSRRGEPPSVGAFRRGGPPPAARGGPPQAGPPKSGFPDPKDVFARLDKDKDKKLSVEEFAAGMKQLHRAAPQRGGPTARGPMGWHGRGPTSMRGGGPMSMHGRGPTSMRGGGPMSMHGRGPTSMRGGGPMSMRGRGPTSMRGRGPTSMHGRGPMPMHGRGPTSMRGRGPTSPQRAAGQQLGMIGGELFKRADANKDGKISLKEVPESRREGFKKLLQEADKDGDQALSGEEARKLGAAVGQRLEEFRKQLHEKMAERFRSGHTEAKKPDRKGPPGKKPQSKKD